MKAKRSSFGLMRIRAEGLALVLATVIMSLTACSGSASVTASDYLGDYAYDAPISAMVYENLDGEGYGIVYREVTDYDKMIGYADVPILLYFFSSVSSGSGDATALVEQLAEDEHGKILVVSVDISLEKDLVSNFSISRSPDFVILKNGVAKGKFSDQYGDNWNDADLTDWVGGFLG